MRTAAWVEAQLLETSIFTTWSKRVWPRMEWHWVEACFCATPLQEERPYWEEYFELLSVKDAHNRKNCRDWNGTEPWACCDCDCTKRLEERLKECGKPFLQELRVEG